MMWWWTDIYGGQMGIGVVVLWQTAGEGAAPTAVIQEDRIVVGRYAEADVQVGGGF